MKCSIENCPGEYQHKLISQVFARNGEAVVIEDIPVKVCDICGDTILNWETVEKLHATLDARQTPSHYVPAFAFGDLVAA
jgi:YgiT-type zinc finger domain-containing protein